MTTVTMDVLEQKLAELRAELFGRFAPASVSEQVKSLRGWRRKMEVDSSFGRVLNGPQWLDRVAIRDGAVDANKLAAQLVISNVFTTAEEPADRVQMSQNGIEGFATIGGTPDQKWMGLSKDGFVLGTGTSNILSYDPETGVWTVPQVFTQGLTISDVAGGRLGGTYYTSPNASDFPRMQISTAGIQAWNSGGTQTFNLNAATGNLTITGTFLLQSAASGSRVDIRNTGITWYNGSQARAQILADGSGFLGSTNGLPSSAAVSWSTNGQAIINASTITTGFMNGQRLTDGSVTDSKVASLSANKITAGTGIINNLTVNATLTLGSGGRIVDADGSYWDQSGMVFRAPVGDQETIQFRDTSNVLRYGIWVRSDEFQIGNPTGSVYVELTEGLSPASRGVIISSYTNHLFVNQQYGTQVRGRFYPGYYDSLGTTIRQNWAYIYSDRTDEGAAVVVNAGGLRCTHGIYPGTLLAPQSDTYLYAVSGPYAQGEHLAVRLWQDVGTGKPGAGYASFRVYNGSGQQVWGVNSQGYMGLIDGTLSSTPGTLAVKVPVSNRGTVRYLYLYDN